MADINIRKAMNQKDFEQGRALFEEYADSLDFDLGYQDFKTELLTIGQQYKEPDGALILCIVDDVAAGCAGIRKFSDGIAELKRLFVKPEHRKLKMGSALLEFAINTASDLNYRLLRLDTVPGQTKAQKLYSDFGFYTIDPYRHSPIPGTLYFEKRLTEK